MVTRIESQYCSLLQSVDVNQKEGKKEGQMERKGPGRGEVSSVERVMPDDQSGWEVFKMLREFFSEWMLGSRWK